MTEPFDDIFLAAFLGEAEEVVGDENELLARCESPIERRFASAFSLYVALVEGRPFELRHETYVPRPSLILEPQVKVGSYRVDFVIKYAGTPDRTCAFVVECDGHDFHERTKAQAARDKARDRYLSVRFAKVLRFTGSEIHYKPFECAAEAFGMADGLYSDWGGGR